MRVLTKTWHGACNTLVKRGEALSLNPDLKLNLNLKPGETP